MPTAAPKLCASCRQTFVEQRCPRCSTSWQTSKRSGSTTAWRRLRLSVFADQSFVCAVDGCTRLTEELDHIVPVARGGTDVRENVQGLCREHHREKTQRESNEQRRREQP